MHQHHGHQHGHHHHHGHHHGHHHTAQERLGWAFVLNFAFTLVELVGGWLTNSTAIMADAVHDLGDSLAIGMAWLLNRLSHKKPSARYSYGYRRLSLFGALFNAIVLVVGSVWVLTEALPRLLNPQMPMVEGMLALALLGVAVNGAAVYKLSGGQTLNEKVLSWHLIEDVLGWLVVLIVSVVLLFVELPILDPIISIGFTLFILFNVLRHLRQTLALFLQAVPDEAMGKQIQNILLACPEVASCHHVHFWSLDGEQHVLTAHLVLVDAVSAEQMTALKKRLAEQLKPFPLQHTTLEFEYPDEVCRDGHP